MTGSPGRLSQAGLKSLPEHVVKPAYDPANVTAGILHLGTGNFALAHLGYYVNGVLAKDPTWGIVAASIRSDSRGIIAGLREQENLYSMVVRHGNKRHAEVLAPVVQTLLSSEGPQRIVAAIANPQIKLVTMTVSNNAYYLGGPESSLAVHNGDVVHDLNLAADAPRTIYWYLTNGLLARKEAGVPLTIMSLDNVQENSAALKKGLRQFVVEAGQSDLLDWIDENVDFPVTTVDRITPDTTSLVCQESLELTGCASAVVVGTEKFHQLVVEKSRFAMPDWADQGVKTVADCAPYWQLKFFCLNAAHCIASMVGLRYGYEFVHEGLAVSGKKRNKAPDPFILQLLKRAHKEFALFVPGGRARVKPYAKSVYSRFGNLALQDENERVAARGTSKVNERLLAAVELAQAAKNGRLISVPTFTTACWLLNLGGQGERSPLGRSIRLGDIHAVSLIGVHDDIVTWLETIEALPDSPDTAPQAVVHDALLRIGELVKEGRFIRMAAQDRFVRELSWCLIAIHKLGVEAAALEMLSRDK